MNLLPIIYQLFPYFVNVFRLRYHTSRPRYQRSTTNQYAIVHFIWRKRRIITRAEIVVYVFPVACELIVLAIIFVRYDFLERFRFKWLKHTHAIRTMFVLKIVIFSSALLNVGFSATQCDPNQIVEFQCQNPTCMGLESKYSAVFKQYIYYFESCSRWRDIKQKNHFVFRSNLFYMSFNWLFYVVCALIMIFISSTYI